MKVLGIIPARSGSLRIKDKNIKDFHGKPLISWTIESALGASSINKTIVSTDDPKIAEIAKSYGANIPFIRPAELANNTIGIEPVLKHAFETMREQGETFDAIALLMPTNPLRKSEHIDSAIDMFATTQADSVVAVHQAAGNRNPHWILKRTAPNKVCFFNDSPLTEIITRSQDLPVCYARNDLIYVLKPDNLYQEPTNLYGEHVELFEMDEFYDADINTPEDWNIALDKLKRQLEEDNRSLN